MWQAAIGVSQPISLCLGLARQRDVIDGPFLNATTLDVSTPAFVPSREAATAVPTTTSGKASHSTGSQQAYSVSAQQGGYQQEQSNWMVIVYDAWSDPQWMAQFISSLMNKGFPVVDVAGWEYWSKMAPERVNLAIVFSPNVSWENRARVYPSQKAAEDDPTSMVSGVNSGIPVAGKNGHQAGKEVYHWLYQSKSNFFGKVAAFFERGDDATDGNRNQGGSGSGGEW